MAEPFATLNDVITLFRPLTAEEAERAEALLPLISDMLRTKAAALGYNWQGTYAIPGGGVAGAIMRTDLKALGLRVQQVRPLEFTGTQYTSGGTDA